MAPVLSEPVRRYLERLEREAKRKSGIVPEEVLCDAREHLMRDVEALQRSEPGITEREVYDHIVETYGEPATVATQYEDATRPLLVRLPGRASGWRICCTRCGRSAPAAKAGITRIGAVSFHKYTLGWCRDCHWFRWLRLEKDLNKPSLTHGLGATNTARSRRERKHRPWSILAMILLATIVPLSLAGWPRLGTALAQQRVVAEGGDRFARVPDDWSVVSDVRVAERQLSRFSQKLGGKVSSLRNVTISDGTTALQINEVDCATEQDAISVHETLSKLKQNSGHVARKHRAVYELMIHTTEHARLAQRAKYELDLVPRTVTYGVQFEAAPVIESDAMDWNRMFNLLRQHKKAPGDGAVVKQIEDIATRFRFSDSLHLKTSGQGGTPIQWKLAPKPLSSQTSISDDSIHFQLSSLPTRVGVPIVSVRGVVTSTALAATPASDATDRIALLSTTKWWPVADDSIRLLSREITSSAESDQAKLGALLAWFTDQGNIRFGGDRIGSRYGTKQVLEQRFGHCWDFADLFTSLARASGLPTRQVMGWLHDAEGHVWCDVLVDDHWQSVDPTSGLACGSNYVPLVVSDDGYMPLVYASDLKITVVQPTQGHEKLNRRQQ